MSQDKSKLAGLAMALHQDLDPLDSSPDGKVVGVPSAMDIVLVHQNSFTGRQQWDMSAMHGRYGNLSTLLSNGYVVKNGILLMSADVPMSGMERRRAKS
jgi:hypothetical protein